MADIGFSRGRVRAARASLAANRIAADPPGHPDHPVPAHSWLVPW